MANKLNRSQTIALGVAAASLAALLLWQVLGSKSSTKSLAAASDDDGDDLKKAKKKASNKGASTPSKDVSTPSGKKSSNANAADEKTPLTSNARSAETKSLHSKIEEIDRRGKALFKGKK